MRRWLPILCLLVACGAAAPVAEAYQFVSPRKSRWEKPKVYYHVNGILAVHAVRAASAWNSVGLRVKLVRVRRAADADILLRTRGQQCSGAVGVTLLQEVQISGPGGRFSLILGPFRILVASRCGATTTYTLAHELGHALGLGHESRRCALMNPDGNAELNRRQCPQRGLEYWLDHLLLPDDIRGARALYRAPLRPELYDGLPRLPARSGGASVTPVGLR